MPETAPRELMILVEQVVRPLPIPLERQKRLRSEFLQHLQAIHTEELARDGDPVAAVARTQRRFGDPAELTKELRASIPWWHRWQGRSQQSLAQRADETALRYTVRFVGRFLIVIFVLMGLILFDHHVFGVEPMSFLKIKTSFAAVLFLAVWLGGFLLFGLQVGAEWERPQRRWTVIVLFSLGHMASWALSLWVLMLLAGSSWFDYSIPMLTSILGGLGSIVCGMVIGVLHRRETNYRREWAELELDAA